MAGNIGSCRGAAGGHGAGTNVGGEMMKVREMIDQLRKFCPDNDVLFVDSWGDEHDF